MSSPGELGIASRSRRGGDTEPYPVELLENVCGLRPCQFALVAIDCRFPHHIHSFRLLSYSARLAAQAQH